MTEQKWSTAREQLDWDLERVDDYGYPMVDENGSTLVPVPRDGPMGEAEASSLSAWAQSYGEVKKTSEILSLDGLLQTRVRSLRKRGAQNVVRKKTT